MASKRFTCKNCGCTFEGDASTRLCPGCGSNEIKVGKGSTAMPKWVKIVAIAVAIIILIILLLKGCGGSDKLTVRKIEDGVSVKIEASGVNKNRLKDYKVQMLLGTDVLDTRKFNSKSGLAVFPGIMLSGTCCNFRVVYKDGKPVENIHWITSTQYCPSEDPIGPEKPNIADIKVDPDRDNKVYTVTIIIADSSTADSYSLLPKGTEPSEDSWQSDNVFKNIEPGSYTAYAKNGSKIDERETVFHDIKELPKELTLPEVQKILDAVCAGTMNPSVAHDKLADGYVDLANPVISEDGGIIESLLNVLTEASQGVCFKVNSFKNDPNTNKIKSGTLNISLK